MGITMTVLMQEEQRFLRVTLGCSLLYFVYMHIFLKQGTSFHKKSR